MICLHSVFASTQVLAIIWSSVECYYSSQLQNETMTPAQVPKIFSAPSDPFEESCLVCSSPYFCPAMISHLYSVLLAYIVISIDYYLASHNEQYERFIKVLETVEAGLLIFFWISLSAFSMLYFSNFFGVFRATGTSYGGGDCSLMSYSFFIATFYLTFYFFVIFLTVVGFCITIYGKFRQSYRERRRREALREGIKNLFQNFYSLKGEDILNFYKKNEQSLAHLPLFDVELSVFQDQFEVDFEVCSNQGYSSCAICFGEDYKPNERVVQFPGCHHGFHFNCLKHWLSAKGICPICRKEFRAEFAKELAFKLDTSFVKKMTRLEVEGRK